MTTQRKPDPTPRFNEIALHDAEIASTMTELAEWYFPSVRFLSVEPEPNAASRRPIWERVDFTTGEVMP